MGIGTQVAAQWSGMTALAFIARRTAQFLPAALLFAMHAGCSNLPTLHPDMALRDPRPVQLEGARGALSPERSKAILASLQAQQPGDSAIFDKHLATEAALVGSPLVVGNRVTLLQDGKATYEAMFDAIAGAKDHINFETYIIDDDEVGKRFADALIGKQLGGVQVNFIYDSVGSIATPREFFKPMMDAGIRVLEFNPVNPLTAKKGWEVNSRDHRKLLIADGQLAFLGGINISSVYSGGGSVIKRRQEYAKTHKPAEETTTERELPWRDSHLRIEGPVVAQFQKMFLATWEKQKGEPLAQLRYFPLLKPAGKDVVRAIGSSPDDEYSLIYVTLISAIRSAESTVYLTNAYFVPDPQFLATLKEAARRGVDVRLILPSKTDSGLVFHAGRARYTELLEAGVKIYERRGGLLHTKAAVIDGVWSTVGSTNLDWRSFLHNDEVNAAILGVEFGAQMRAMFEADLAQSDQITLEQWQRRSLANRMKESYSRLWEYWL
jgi:cardiolipin synthase A/B